MKLNLILSLVLLASVIALANAQTTSFLYVCGSSSTATTPRFSEGPSGPTSTLPCPGQAGFTTAPSFTSSVLGQLLNINSASISLNMPNGATAATSTGPSDRPSISALTVTFPVRYGPIPAFYDALLLTKKYQTVVLLNTVSGRPVSAYVLTNVLVSQITGGGLSSDYSVTFNCVQFAVQSWAYKSDGSLVSPSGPVASWDLVRNSVTGK